MAQRETLRVAAVQAAPVFLDPAATVEKAVGLVEQAASGGARLIAFGEGFLSGHPIWLHVDPVTSPAQIAFASELVRSAIMVPGPETARLSQVARRTGATIVLGAVERLAAASSSLALCALVVQPDGEVAGRRKLVPAVGERVLFTPGEGDGIRVFPSPWGPLSVLLGGENSNPLFTWTVRELGARIHLALWPPHFNKPGVMGETATITGRAIAYQNSAHVISVAGATTEAVRERIARSPDDRALLDAMAADPASAIYAPRGALLAGPLPGGDGILYADLDLGAGAWPSLVNRQYDRPDLFRVTIDRSSRPEPLAFADRSNGAAGVVASGSGAARIADDRVAYARRLIAERYGDRLEAGDAERLLPFVVSVLETPPRFEAAEPSTPDRATAGLPDEGRSGS